MFRITRIYASDICAGGNILQQACFPIAGQSGAAPARGGEAPSDHGVIFAVNGTCKTTLISFLLNTFCPEKKRFVQHLQSGGDKTLEQYLVPGRPAVVLIEMAVVREESLFDSAPEERLVIGQVLYTHREASKPMIRHYFQAQFPELFDGLREEWPFLLEGPRPLAAVREYLSPRVVMTDVQKDWWKRLTDIGLDPWLVDRQIDFARSEGGIKDAFRFRSEAEFLSFFLGCVTNMALAGELRKATLTNMGKMQGRPKKKAQLEAVLSLQTRLQEFETIAGQWRRARAQRNQCIRSLEEAAILVDQALPRARAEKETAQKKLHRTELEKGAARTELNALKADQLKARAFALDMDEKRLTAHAADLDESIKAVDLGINAVEAAALISRINLATRQLRDKKDALAASGSELAPHRQKADQLAGEYHACIARHRSETGRAMTAAVRERDTAAADLNRTRDALKQTARKKQAKEKEISQLKERLDMAQTARKDLEGDPLDPPASIRDRLSQALHQARKDLELNLKKHQELKKNEARENKIREALTAQEARDMNTLAAAEERKNEESRRRENLLADPNIRAVAGSDSFDPTNAAHVSALSESIERKTRKLGQVEKEVRTLDSEIHRLDEVRTLAVDGDTRRLIRHYRDQGISPSEIRAFPEYLASQDLGADATAEFIHRDPARFTGMLAMNSDVMDRILALDVPQWLRRPVVVSLPANDIQGIEEIPHKRIFPPDPAIYTKEGAARLKQTLSLKKEELDQTAQELIQANTAMGKSMDALKTYRESFPDPAAVKRLDIDMDMAARALEKTRQDIAAARERMAGIQENITRCQHRGNELSAAMARLEMQLKQVNNWLRQYGDWEFWEGRVRKNETALRQLDTRIEALEKKGRDLEEKTAAAARKIPALEKDMDRLDEVAQDVPAPLTPPGHPDGGKEEMGDMMETMDLAAIKTLYVQANEDLKRMSMELGVALLEQEIEELGKGLVEYKNDLDRFQSAHPFDREQARDFAAKSPTERQKEKQALNARKQKEIEEKSLTQAKADLSAQDLTKTRDKLKSKAEKGIHPRLSTMDLEALSPEAVVHTLEPDLATQSQDLEAALDTLDQRLVRYREELDILKDWFNSLTNLGARAGDAPQLTSPAITSDWPDLSHPQNRLANCREMDERIKDLLEEKKEGDKAAKALSRKRDEKFRDLTLHIQDSDFEVTIPKLVDALREHDASSLGESCRAIIENCDGIVLNLEGDLARSATIMDAHVIQLLEHAKDCHQKLVMATQVTIPEQVFTYGGKSILRAAARLNFSRFEQGYKESLENWMEERIQTGLCPQVTPAEGNCLGAHLLYRLLGVEAKKTFSIRLLKCDDTARNYEPVGRDLGSGGEALTTSVLLYALLVSMRSKRFKGGARPMPGFLILDNPLGVCNRPEFLDAQLKVADALGVQCIYLTGINDTGSIELFEHRIVIRKAHRQLTIDGRPFEKLETVQIHVEG